MSIVFANHVMVTGLRDEVHRLRRAARRRIPPHRVKHYGTRQVEWSFEKLFRRHPELASRFGEPPHDDGNIWSEARASRIARWKGYWRFRFFFEVRNWEIHDLLRQLSGFYPNLCFVDAELCLDDGSLTSRFTRRRRTSTWELPGSRQDAHWRAAARELGIEDLDEAYEDDTARAEAETGMFEEALAHWDDKVLGFLRRLA